MDTSSHLVEVTVISGEDLFISKNQRVKRNAFVIVKTDASNSQTTEMDKDGGSNPAWNQKLNVNISSHARSITVEVHCKTSSGIKIVGMANIPTSDFLGGYAPQCLHFLSYRLKDVNGRSNGIINVSVRVKMAGDYSNAYDGKGNCSRPAFTTGFGVPVDAKMSSSGVVTGFPVGYNYRS